MIELLGLILHVMASFFKPKTKLVAEILILRQQLNVLRRVRSEDGNPATDKVVDHVGDATGRDWRGHYSITSSARASSVGGASRPSAFAVLRLMTSSYFVGACTGRSAGFSPLRMRSTYSVARRVKSSVSGP